MTYLPISPTQIMLNKLLIFASTALLITSCTTLQQRSSADLQSSDMVSASANTENSNPNSEIIEIDDLNQIQDVIDKQSASNTLFVVDIDDTLLTANEFFGSDKWYEWQLGRAESPTGEEISISESEQVNCLFDFLSVAFEIGTNTLTQPDASEFMESIDLDILILTARSENYRSATMRELLRNGLSFSDDHLVAEGEAVRFLGDDKIRQAPVSYIDGVYMVSGLNKGIMLLGLLEKVDKSYSTVLFVDDKLNNITHMQEALQEASINYYGFHYTRIDKSVSEEEITEAVDATHDLNSFLQEHFPERVEILTSESCALRTDLVR